MSVFPRLFFIAFSGVFQRWEFKNTTKNVLQNNRVEIVLQKFDQKSKTDFFSNWFFSRFWAFLDEGGLKSRFKQNLKNKSDPSPFPYSDPPTHHGGPRFFFCGPSQIVAPRGAEEKKNESDVYLADDKSGR
jgi:hypothetical protein